jgi:hypothetical protein
MGSSILPCRTDALRLLRNLYRELRPSTVRNEDHVYRSKSWNYIIRQARNQQTENTAIPLTFNLGQTYLIYLKSSHLHLALVDSYKGKGELSAMETATRVGFRLPHDSPLPRESKSESS